MESLWHDMRFAWRDLCRIPAVTGLALVALALWIGANTAIFSVVRGVLVKPLPYGAPTGGSRSPRLERGAPRCRDRPPRRRGRPAGTRGRELPARHLRDEAARDAEPCVHHETAQIHGDKPEHMESISTGSATHVLVQGRWHSATKAAQAMREEMLKKKCDGKSQTCGQLRDEQVGGEAAAVYRIQSGKVGSTRWSRGVHDGRADHFLNREGVGGWLNRTGERLLFRSHAFNPQPHVLSIPFAELAAVEVVRTAGIVQCSVRVVTRTGGDKRFVVNRNRRWCAAIEGARTGARPL